VTIRYDPNEPDILTDVNLKFKAGERVAVVGRTGSGKSTVSTECSSSTCFQ
jgi:ABC-type bacteriocin/lantibiotic exporter with double-glycine peptidase domain